MNETPETALSVTGLTEYIKLLLEEDPQLIKVWVTGEVSSLHVHRMGVFFTLSDNEGRATIKCVVWNSQKERLLELPKPGSEILVMGNVRLYARKGEYQLTVFQRRILKEKKMNKKSDIVETLMSWAICLVTLLLGVCLMIPFVTGNISFQDHLYIIVVSLVLLADSVVFFPPFQCRNLWKYVGIGLTLAVFYGLF